jgi:acyl-CoA thioesterase
MSESEQAHLVVSKMMETDFFSQWLGIEIMEVSPGFCRLRMVVRKEMLNGFGILHGGISFSLADSCFAFATNSKGMLSLSLQASISFPATAVLGEVLVAESKELNLTKSSGLYDIEIKKEGKSEIVGLFRGVAHRTSRPALGL